MNFYARSIPKFNSFLEKSLLCGEEWSIQIRDVLVHENNNKVKTKELDIEGFFASIFDQFLFITDGASRH